jgi:altronate hydrolase
MARRFVKVHPSDNVGVAVRKLPAGERVEIEGEEIIIRSDVPAGHKFALEGLAAGDAVKKYGYSIGRVTEAVEPGTHLHTHNMETGLEGKLEYTYQPETVERVEVGTLANSEMPTFQGYRRSEGKVGTRNEIWIINTVGCVNTAARRISRQAEEFVADKAHVDGVHSFSHPYGCSQLGDDLVNTQKVLSGLIRHPNAGGVLVLGLGCENNQMDDLLAMAGDANENRLRFFNSQEVLDEVEEGKKAVAELAELMEADQRETCPITDLVLGLKCGGSDGFSGLSANPLVGRIADRLTGYGGTALLTEVPEMFGAEQLLMNRAADEPTFERVVQMINDFKDYFTGHDQPIYENPSPGNKEGGLTTLEDKSLGATQKGGQATVTQVLDYSDRAAPRGGLALLYGPGNDGVSSTNMVAAGATVLLFTTGRGTPLGFPVPTLKISSNTEIAEKKPHWIDFNAGALLDGEATMEEMTDQLFEMIVETASGRHRANNEENDYREIAIWKEGVTL